LYKYFKPEKCNNIYLSKVRVNFLNAHPSVFWLKNKLLGWLKGKIYKNLGCSIVWSEDLNSGQYFGEIKVINPFCL